MCVKEIAELLNNGQIDLFNNQMEKSNDSVKYTVLMYIIDNFDITKTVIKLGVTRFRKYRKKPANFEKLTGEDSMVNDIELYRNYIEYISSKMKQFGLDDVSNFIQNRMDFTYDVVSKYDEKILIKELAITESVMKKYNIMDCLSYIRDYKLNNLL